MAEARPAGRRTFGPVVLLGLASAGLAAVAGNRPWVEWTGTSEGQGSLLTVTGDDTATVPLAGALALALLACWGVVLVTRGRVRRAIAVLALVVSAGMVATAVLGYRSATHGLRSDLAELGIDDLSVQPVVWYWVFLACAVVAVVADRRGRPPGARVARDGQQVRRPRSGAAAPRGDGARPVEGARRGTRPDPHRPQAPRRRVAP